MKHFPEAIVVIAMLAFIFLVVYLSHHHWVF